MHIALAILFILCPVAALTFIVRLACATFSARVSDQMRRHPVVHWIWGGFAFVGVILFFGVLHPEAWPPPALERRGQRRKVAERVQTAGGWEAVRQDCEALAASHPNGLTWFPPSSNAWVYSNPQTEPHRYYITNLDYGPLPSAVAALQPREIRYYPSGLPGDSKGEPQVCVVHIKLFGIHSTGGHSTPYYGLEVPCGKGAERYEPQPTHGGVSGNRHMRFRKLADGVFEIY